MPDNTIGDPWIKERTVGYKHVGYKENMHLS